MAPGGAESDFGLQGWIGTLGLKQIFLSSIVVAAVVVSFFFQLPYAERLLSGSLRGKGSQLGDDVLELNGKISHCNTWIRPLCSLDSNPPTPPTTLRSPLFLCVFLVAFSYRPSSFLFSRRICHLLWLWDSTKQGRSPETGLKWQWFHPTRHSRYWAGCKDSSTHEHIRRQETFVIGQRSTVKRLT